MDSADVKTIAFFTPLFLPFFLVGVISALIMIPISVFVVVPAEERAHDVRVVHRHWATFEHESHDRIIKAAKEKGHFVIATGRHVSSHDIVQTVMDSYEREVIGRYTYLDDKISAACSDKLIIARESWRCVMANYAELYRDTTAGQADRISVGYRLGRISRRADQVPEEFQSAI